MNEIQLESYLTNGVENIVKGIWKASLKNPGASVYMMQYQKFSKEANQIRRESELGGKHIPPFLIASITTSCNLHCAGCYARANHNCVDGESRMKDQLDGKQWDDIFTQAEQLGIAFILLAGGEPMIRKDILEVAKTHKRIVFPVFTNGTLFTKERIELLKSAPNLLPVISIEGSKETTDLRRGEGVYEKLWDSMELLSNRGIIFGSSITVQKDNMDEIMSDTFLKGLIKKGCKAVIYVEYVPVSKGTESIALNDNDRLAMSNRLQNVRKKYPELLFISFPGDEKTSGGCLAAGRGFFHINAYGSAEPCPFSAYSDTSLKNVSLEEALQSPLFLALQSSRTLLVDHKGGCVLFEQEEKVRELCKEKL